MFRFYRSGLIVSQRCGTDVNLAVLAVGYGVATLTKGEYYIVKNAWGAAWGDNGYVKIGIEDGPGICGIHTYPSQPIF
jgi:C1A family cysteine protease